MSNALIDSYTKEELQNIVESSASIAEIAEKLGYTTKNGRNAITIKKRLDTIKGHGILTCVKNKGHAIQSCWVSSKYKLFEWLVR